MEIENIPPVVLDRDTLMNKYSDYLLEHNESPKNVHQFMKEIGYEESDFYRFFGSFEALEAFYFEYFFEETLRVLADNTSYHLFSAKEKLSTFYFTFIENLSLNRSLVKLLLKRNPKSANSLKKPFLHYVENLNLSSGSFEKLSKTAENIQKKISTESLWAHFASIMIFWTKDGSPNFEQTDIYIEKSLDTGFTLLEHQPLQKVVDLGKFLFRENKIHEKFR